MDGILGSQWFFIGFIMLLVVITVGFVIYLLKYVLRQDTGTKKMQEMEQTT